MVRMKEARNEKGKKQANNMLTSYSLPFTHFYYNIDLT